MAEATPHPALPSTADTVPYVPVSWMAVAAATAAGVFVVVLLALGVSAFVAKKPLVIPELLTLAVAGLVLSFAARRMIRNSEGTRTGERLANAAWWASLLVGLGYAAYLFGVDFSVRRDAQDEVKRWVGYLTAPDARPSDFNRAFLRTLEPGARGPLSPEDTASLEARFPAQLAAFNQGELVRVVRRNAGSCEYAAGGVKDWLSKPGLIECSVVGTLKCPEGTFPIEVPLRGFEAVGKAEAIGRQWQVVHEQQGGFVAYVAADRVARTPYGWVVADLEQSGGQAGREFVQRSGTSAPDRAFLYQFAINPDPQPGRAFWDALPALGVLQGLTRVDARLLLPFTRDYQSFTQDRFARLPGGGELARDRRLQFAKSWNEFGLLAPGRRLPNNDKVDAHDVLTVTDSAVEVRVPCEIPMSGAGGNLAAARGRVVMSCADPSLLADLKRLRAEARPDGGTTTPPDGLTRRQILWRVVAVETNMSVVEVQRDRGGPGGMGGGE